MGRRRVVFFKYIFISGQGDGTTLYIKAAEGSNSTLNISFNEIIIITKGRSEM